MTGKTGVFIVASLALTGCGSAARFASRSNDAAILAYARAAADYDAGDLGGAASSAKLSLESDRRFLPAIVLLGKVSYFSGDAAAAIEALETGMDISPRSGETALWLSRAYRAAGRDDDARRVCELLLSADPSNVAALRQSASMAIDAGDPPMAMACLDRAIVASGESGLAFADRAALLWAAGDRDGCIADLRAAMAILPVDCSAYRAVVDLMATIEGQLR